MEKQEPAWHEETIGIKVIHTLRDLWGCSVLASFYLAGGTGLALHLGHRRSADLDFFRASTFNEDALIQKVQHVRDFSLLAKGPGTIHAHIRDTKVSFLAFAYPLLFPHKDYREVAVADPRDIACMKVNAIAGRGTKRDFIDLRAVAQDYGLSQILSWCKEKFAAANYSTVHLLKSLTYFDDAENEPEPDMLVPCSWAEVKDFFRREVPRLL